MSLIWLELQKIKFLLQDIRNQDYGLSKHYKLHREMLGRP